MNAPIVDTKLYPSQPSPASYVYVRRGCPSRPEMCSGNMLRLNPRNTSQNEILPSRSSSSLPVIFGPQWNRAASIGKTAPPTST